MITAYRLKTAKVNQKKLNEKEWPAKYSCRFWEPGVVSYEDVGAGVALLQKETMDKMIPSFIGKPVIIDHDDLNPGNFKEHAVGYISDVKYNEKDGWYYADFILTDDEAKRKVQNGYSVSCGFDATNTGPGGEWHAVKYNEEITDGVFEHMALVTNPRYEGSKIYVNSKKDNSDASNKTYDALLKEIQSIQVMTEEKCRAMVAKIDSSNLSASEKDNLEHNLGKQRARSHSKDNANPVLERLIEIARGLIAEGMPMDKVLKQFKPDDAKRIEAVLTKENAASFMCPQCGADVSGEQETEAGIICPKCHTDFWKSEALTPKAIAEGKRPLRGGKQNSSGIIKAKKVSNATGEKPMFGFFKKKRKNEAPVTDEDKKKKEAEILADKSKKDMENAGEPVAAPAAPAEQDLNELLIPIDGQMVPVAELIKVFKAEQLEKAEYEELSLEDEVTEKEAGNKFKMNDLINCYKAKAKKNASDEKWFHRPKKEKGGYGKEIVEFDTNKVIDETGVYPSEAEAYQEAERIISSLKREKKNSEEETPEAKAEREKKENEDKAKAEAEAAEKAKKEKENSETPEQKAEREKKEKENAEETPEEKAAKEAASAEEKELQIQKDNAKKNPRDLKYFMRINGLKDAGEAITDFALETVHDKIERGNHRYGSKKSQQ